MPALATHRLVGERLIQHGRVPSCVRAWPSAFLVGCQGPDPLFFRFRAAPTAIVRTVRAGSALHRRYPAEVLERLVALGEAAGDDALAFALGMACHYAVDRTAHPLVYATQHALSQDDPALALAPHETHACIEADLDVYLLHAWDDKSLDDVELSDMLDLDERQTTIAGAMVARAASDVVGLKLTNTDYPRALADMRTLYKINEPYGRPTTRAIARVERLARTHSMIAALSHRDFSEAGRTWANLKRHAWVDPRTHEERTESFEDLLDASMSYWETLTQALLDRRDVTSIVASIDYNG